MIRTHLLRSNCSGCYGCSAHDGCVGRGAHGGCDGHKGHSGWGCRKAHGGGISIVWERDTEEIRIVRKSEKDIVRKSKEKKNLNRTK